MQPRQLQPARERVIRRPSALRTIFTVAGCTPGGPGPTRSCRRSELEWLLHRLPDLFGEERQLIEQMSNRLVAGILHAPRTALNADSSGTLSRAARELFGV